MKKTRAELYAILAKQDRSEVLTYALRVSAEIKARAEAAECRGEDRHAFDPGGRCACGAVLQ